MKKCINYNMFFPADIDAKGSSSVLFIYYNRVTYVIILNLYSDNPMKYHAK